MSKSQEDVQCPQESKYTTMIRRAQTGDFLQKVGPHVTQLENEENRDILIRKCFEGVHTDYVATDQKNAVQRKSTMIVNNVVQTLQKMKDQLFESSTKEHDMQTLFVQYFNVLKEDNTIRVESEVVVENAVDPKKSKRIDVLIEFEDSNKKYAFLLEFKKGMTQSQANTALPQLFQYSLCLMRKNIIVLGLLLLFNGCDQNNLQRMYCYAWPYAKQLQNPKEPAPGTDGGGAPGGAQNGGRGRGGTRKRKRKEQRGSAPGDNADGSKEEGAAEGHAAASNEGGEHEVDKNNVTKIVNKEQYAPLKALQEFLLLEDSEHFGAFTITYITDELKNKQITLENTPESRKSKDFITFWKDWYNLFCREANISNKVYLDFSEAEKNKNQHNLTFVLYQHKERWFLCCCVEKTQASFQWYHIREKYDNEKQTIPAYESEFYEDVDEKFGVSIHIKFFNYKFSHAPNDVWYSAVHTIYNLLLALLLRKKDESFSIGSFEEKPSEITPTFNSQNISKKMLMFINSQNITEIDKFSIDKNMKKNIKIKKYWYVSSSILITDKISSNFEEIQKGSVFLEPQDEKNGVQYAVGIVIQKDDISFTIEFRGFTREEGLYKIFTGYYEKALDGNEIPYYAKKNISNIPSQPHIPLYLCKKETLFLNDNNSGERNNQTMHNTLVDLLVRKIELLLCAQ